MEICHIEVNIFLEETEENLHILHLKIMVLCLKITYFKNSTPIKFNQEGRESASLTSTNGLNSCLALIMDCNYTTKMTKL